MTTTIERSDFSIANALYNKSKLSFRQHWEDLVRQGARFSPIYRDFIAKIIRSGSLKIRQEYRGGSIRFESQDDDSTSLKKRGKTLIHTDIENPDILAHELGHAVDYWFGESSPLTSTIVLSTGKTMAETFAEEFQAKCEELYHLVMDEYKAIIASSLNDKAYEILVENMPIYNELCAIRCNLRNKESTRKRRAIQKTLYEKGFVETYFRFLDRKCYSILNQKYAPILDALSSYYDFDGLGLKHHSLAYYRLDEKNLVAEFFANLFEAEVTSKHVQFDHLIHLMPSSFSAFQELFCLFYERIQKNRRFTDIELRKEPTND